MNALDLLRNQHREIDAIFGELETATGFERKILFEEQAEKILNHMQIEEQIFYPAVFDPDADEFLVAVVQHGDARPMIDELLRMEGGSDRFNDALEELKETLMHHITEEEAGIFARCEDELSSERLEELGQQMEDLLAELRAQYEPVPMEPLTAHHHVGPYGSVPEHPIA